MKESNQMARHHFLRSIKTEIFNNQTKKMLFVKECNRIGRKKIKSENAPCQTEQKNGKAPLPQSSQQTLPPRLSPSLNIITNKDLVFFYFDILNPTQFEDPPPYTYTDTNTNTVDVFCMGFVGIVSKLAQIKMSIT